MRKVHITFQADRDSCFMGKLLAKETFPLRASPKNEIPQGYTNKANERFRPDCKSDGGGGGWWLSKAVEHWSAPTFDFHAPWIYFSILVARELKRSRSTVTSCPDVENRL